MCGLTMVFYTNLCSQINCESNNCAGLIYVDGCVCESIERKCTQQKHRKMVL